MDLETFVASLNNEQVESLYKLLPDLSKSGEYVFLQSVQDLRECLEVVMDNRQINY